MAATQDMESPQMSLNSPGPSASQDAGTRPRIAESQGGLRVEVTVLRAHNVPRVKNVFGLKFFVTVTSQATKKKTPSVRAEGATVQWNENLGPLIVQPSSRLVLRLYADRFARRDTLIGRHEMIPVESQTEFPFVLTNSDRMADQSIEPVMLYLTVIVSPNSTSSPAFAANLRPTEVGDLPSGEATRLPSEAQVSTNTTRSTVTTGSETAENALQDADEAITTINLSNTLEGALERIKWVMDAVSSVAELHPYAKMAYGLLFAIPKTLLEQFQRDDNIRTLLGAMHDAFDFANREDRFKTVERVPRQAQILTLMLQHVCHCCDFIQSYAKNSQLSDKKIEDFRNTLLELHKAFLDEATITTEITALQILDDVGIISAQVGIISADVGRVSSQLDGMATQLKWVSNQVIDTEIDAKIREIPYGTGSRFTPDKGCLAGTRTAFLDFIVNWVNDPASERCLVLFGQAGTGKSCIAHEIAHSFDKIHRLTSSFIFLRKEQSKREAYHLFTTLARDLSDRYPSFKSRAWKARKGQFRSSGRHT
ncbi:hypothetical protein EDB83DRAFT_2515581 [Lactarius deliciosus]|nr:hypothetical protein EDB83DRAFT_2515581 [Lactarius deliciosus]